MNQFCLGCKILGQRSEKPADQMSPQYPKNYRKKYLKIKCTEMFNNVTVELRTEPNHSSKSDRFIWLERFTN